MEDKVSSNPGLMELVIKRMDDVSKDLNIVKGSQDQMKLDLISLTQQMKELSKDVETMFDEIKLHDKILRGNGGSGEREGLLTKLKSVETEIIRIRGYFKWFVSIMSAVGTALILQAVIYILKTAF